jgi:hypothetical protein
VQVVDLSVKTATTKTNVSGITYTYNIKQRIGNNKMAVELTDLELEIATELAQYDWVGHGKEFWAEVERLAQFGDNWVDHLPE